MKKYVIGFMFDQTKQNVVLIRKNRPEWQAGALNGVGGKIEEGETPICAVIREFWEETGVQSNSSDWVEVLLLKFPYAEVTIFAGKNDYHFFMAQTRTDEEVVKRRSSYCFGFHGDERLVENLPELIGLSLQRLNDQPGVAPKTWSETQ